MKKYLILTLLMLSAFICIGQTTNLQDAAITDPKAVPGSNVVVGTNKRVTFLAPAPASGNFIKVTINGVEQWEPFATFIAGLPIVAGPAGPQGPIGNTGAQGLTGPAGSSATLPIGAEGNALVFHAGSWQAFSAGLTLCQGVAQQQTGNYTLCIGNTLVAGMHSIASTINVTAYTSGTITMYCDYTDQNGNAQTQPFPVYNSKMQGAQCTISIIPMLNKPVKCYTVVSADWVGTYDGSANVHQF